MKFLFSVLIVLLCCQCDNSPRNLDEFMVDVSRFDVKDSLLDDFDYVEILGLSGNLTQEHKIDFYNLVVVRSMDTGDTINVLVTNFYKGELMGRTTRFVSNNSTIGKLFESTEEFKKNENFHLEDLEPKRYEKVFYDTEFIQVDVFDYPTIIGTLANWQVDGDLKNLEKLNNRPKDSISETK